MERFVTAITIGLAATLGLFSACTNPQHEGMAEQALSFTLTDRDKRALNFSVVWHDKASAYELDLQANVGVTNRATLSASEVAAVDSRFTAELFVTYKGDADPNCDPEHERRYVLSYHDAERHLGNYFICFSGDNQLDPETQYTFDDLAGRAKAILELKTQSP